VSRRAPRAALFPERVIGGAPMTTAEAAVLPETSGIRNARD
jgi:hypothetical protein